MVAALDPEMMIRNLTNPPLSFADRVHEPAAPPPLFPVDVFDSETRRYVVSGAAALGVPVDMVAVPLLGFAAGVIGNSRLLMVKPGWLERVNLWLAIIGDPGTGKSPAIAYARAPIDALQNRAMKVFADALEKWDEAVAEAKANKEAPPEKPRLQHFFTTDATMEAVASILDGSAGVSLLREELVGWVKSHDAYRKGGDRQNWLSLWAGAPLKVDRKTSGVTYVRFPVIPVIGGIQPDLLSSLSEEFSLRDGFVDRVLASYPVARAMRWTDAETDSTAEWAVNQIFAKLRIPLAADEPPPIARFDVEARREFARWHDENAEIVETTTGLASGCYAKYPSQLARIILVLQALRYPDEPSRDVSVAMVRSGIEVIEYFRAHLKYVLPAFSTVGSDETAGVTARVLRVLSRECPRRDGGWTPRTDIHRGLGGNVKAPELAAVLERLETAGQVENRQVKSGHKPREETRLVHMKNEDIEDMKISRINDDGENSYLHIFDGTKEELRI